MPTLKELAQRLPRMVKCDEAGNQIKIQRTYLGSHLISKGIKDVDGQKINPKKKYLQMIPDYVDHHKELKKLYRKSGWAAVMRYVQACQAVPQMDKRTKKTERRKVQNPKEVKTVRTERVTFKTRLMAFWIIVKREFRRIFKRK